MTVVNDRDCQGRHSGTHITAVFSQDPTELLKLLPPDIHTVPKAITHGFTPAWIIFRLSPISNLDD